MHRSDVIQLLISQKAELNLQKFSEIHEVGTEALNWGS
jgi:hypothetical protein